MHHFPDLLEQIGVIEDCRQEPQYEIVEIIMAGIALFVLKKGSRNAFNNEREEAEFRQNYQKLFKVRLPHLDTVDEVMRQLEEHQLETLKTELVRGLLAKKTFQKYRLFGKYYPVVIDGSHIITVHEGHCEHCLHRTSKNGKVTYFHNVLEAKLVCANGFCMSLGTEWIENPRGEYDKQDCEQKAFVRVAKKLKQAYPRLPICLVADGLYPNRTFFQTCQDKGWMWIVTFKDGNLPTVWKAELQLQKTTTGNTRQETVYKGDKQIQRTYTWLKHLDYQEFALNWFECVEEVEEATTRFVYISNLEVDYHNILEITDSGRMRWKIENEGFDIQKHHGYGLGHQYSRVSMRAMKNYYQCLQIAHMMNQLVELSSLFAPLLSGKITVSHLWKRLLGELRHLILDVTALTTFLGRRMQLRYD
jgi:hypothetical protein